MRNRLRFLWQGFKRWNCGNDGTTLMWSCRLEKATSRSQPEPSKGTARSRGRWPFFTARTLHPQVKPNSEVVVVLLVDTPGTVDTGWGWGRRSITLSTEQTTINRRAGRMVDGCVVGFGCTATQHFPPCRIVSLVAPVASPLPITMCKVLHKCERPCA